MSISQILTSPTPLLRGNKLFKSRLQAAIKQIRNVSVTTIKSIKRSYKQIARQHYFLPTAIKDLKKASAQNEDIVVAAITWTAILVYACAVIATQFVLSISKATFAMSEANGLNVGLMLLAVGASVILFSMLLSATSMSFLSLAIMDGANRKVYKSIRTTLGKSLKMASRLTSAWFLLGIVHLVRTLAVLIPIILYVKWFSAIANLSAAMLIVLTGLGVIWLLAGLLRYSMVPYVALFEPQYLLTESFERSRQLVNKQAVVFMATGSVVMTGYIFGMYKSCLATKQWLGDSTSNLLFIVSVLAGLMLANGAMVMLYRKRKLARH